MNPIGLQRVGESTDASCLTNISPVPQEFTFTTFGNAAACQDDFHIAWQDQVGRSPYSMTVVPLDTSYNPWDVALTGGVIQPDYAWTVNMTAGTKFTLIMTYVSSAYAIGYQSPPNDLSIEGLRTDAVGIGTAGAEAVSDSYTKSPTAPGRLAA